jgi:hypothetical protein
MELEGQPGTALSCRHAITKNISSNTVACIMCRPAGGDAPFVIFVDFV